MHVICIPCYRGMVRAQVAEICRVVANILNKQYQTADRGCSSRVGFRRGRVTKCFTRSNQSSEYFN
jgi:hypothetical protein